MLQETTVLSGKIRYPWTRGSIAYCSQKPWIQSSRTLAENIIFVSSMDPDWYRTVVKACALDVDFANMPDGDQSSADKLSGGQQARIVCDLFHSSAKFTEFIYWLGTCACALYTQGDLCFR